MKMVIPIRSSEYSNLRRAISKLANDDDDSLVRYQKSLDVAADDITIYSKWQREWWRTLPAVFR